MASEQLINKPKIFEVQDPATNAYVVMVLMATHITAKYPSKPWGTNIKDIGLSPSDAALYPNYVLVDFEPLKGSSDLFWIFQNLDTAPTWTTKSLGIESLTPQKYRRQVAITKTKQDVDPDTEPTALTGDITSSIVEQQDNTGKAIRVDTSEVIESSTALAGEEFAPGGAILATSELLVADGVLTEKGVNIASSVVEPIGNGKSVKQTKTAKKRPSTGADTPAAGWPQGQVKSKGSQDLTPQKFRRLVTTDIITTQETLAQVYVDDIPAPATPSGDQAKIEHKKVNDYRYEKSITSETIVAGTALDGKKSSPWGQLTTAESYVADGTALGIANGVAEASVVPVGNGKSVKEVVSYPTPDGDGIIAEIDDEDQDATTGIITDIKKILITNDGYAAKAAALRAESPPWFVERKGQDQYHCVLIASRASTTLPFSVEFWDTDSISLPDTLLSIDVLWGSESGGGNGSSSNEDGGSARASAAASTSPSIEISVQKGFSGKTKCKIVRTYQRGPSTDVIDPINIIPVMGSATLFSSSRSFSCNVSTSAGGGSIGTETRVGTSGRMMQFGPFLSNNVSSPGGANLVDSGDYTASAGSEAAATASVTVTGNASVLIPESQPVSIAYGDIVARYQKVQQWRLDIWIVETVTVYAPAGDFPSAP